MPLSKSEISVREHFHNPGTEAQHFAANAKRGRLLPDADEKFAPHANGDNADPTEMTADVCYRRGLELALDADDAPDVESRCQGLEAASRHLMLAASKLRNPNSRAHSVRFVR